MIKIVEKELEKKGKKAKKEDIERALHECNFDPDCAAEHISSS